VSLLVIKKEGRLPLCFIIIQQHRAGVSTGFLNHEETQGRRFQNPGFDEGSTPLHVSREHLAFSDLLKALATGPRPCMRALRWAYLSFFFTRSWFEWPHFFFLQLVARGGRRA